MTVGQLKKALKGIPNDIPVVTKAHDNRELEYQDVIRSVELFDFQN